MIKADIPLLPSTSPVTVLCMKAWVCLCCWVSGERLHLSALSVAFFFCSEPQYFLRINKCGSYWTQLCSNFCIKQSVACYLCFMCPEVVQATILLSSNHHIVMALQSLISWLFCCVLFPLFVHFDEALGSCFLFSQYCRLLLWLAICVHTHSLNTRCCRVSAYSLG